jgi:hypothetical protein
VAKLLAQLDNLAKFNHLHKMIFEAAICSKSLQGKRFLSIDLSEIGQQRSCKSQKLDL